MLRVMLAVALLLPAAAAPARAQSDEPIGLFVGDVRGSLGPFRQNRNLALLRGLQPAATPTLGIGFEAGAHVHVLRLGFLTLGLGASFHTSFADRAADEDETRQAQPPALRRTFRALSPQLSFNFGGRNGWSYLSGGLGTSRLSLGPRDGEQPPARSARTLNYGGGARWFLNRRVAFSVDLRFYAISPLERTTTDPASPRMTLTVANVGISLRP